MSDIVRQFTPKGNEEFKNYLSSLQGAPSSPPPWGLLTDPEMSCPVDFVAKIDRMPHKTAFLNRYAFGRYLVQVLGNADRAKISLAPGLWNWLALYYFDQLCPLNADGKRSPRETSVYFLPERFQHNRYYRHLVRTPWLAVSLHPVFSQVILIPISTKGPALVVTGEIFEQVASRQGVFRSPTIMAAIYAMYFDPSSHRPRSGSGGSAGGSPRRLGQILKQFELTYDLEWGNNEVILKLLPKEFNSWTSVAGTPSAS